MTTEMSERLLLRQFSDWVKAHESFVALTAQSLEEYQGAMKSASDAADRFHETNRMFDLAIDILEDIEYIDLMNSRYCPLCTHKLGGHYDGCRMHIVLSYFRKAKEEYQCHTGT